MALPTQDVIHIAHLARLAIEQDEISAYADQLSPILDLVNQINELDTKAIAPMAHPLDQKQRLRPDVITEPNQREQFQQNAPETAVGLYLVPQVIE